MTLNRFALVGLAVMFAGAGGGTAIAGPIGLLKKSSPGVTNAAGGSSASNNAGGSSANNVPLPTSVLAAETLDCTDGCHNEIFGGAVWSTDNVIHPSGTGVFEPFLRLQNTGQGTTEDGHNTDAKSKNFANDEKGGIWTHSVLMSEVTLREVDGFAGLFYRFALDFGEPAAADKSLLSLDALKLCTSNDPSLTQADDCPTQPYHYNLDAGNDREVLLDYNLIGRGNGSSDLFVYVPEFKNPGTYLYLYSAFGAKGGAYQAQGTFAEWAFDSGPARHTVPEPASLLLLGLGIVAVGATRRTARS